MGTSGSDSASAASTDLTEFEFADLAAIALALPPGWIVAVTPPHGQIQLCPPGRRPRHHQCWIFDGYLRIAYRDNVRRPLRGLDGGAALQTADNFSRKV